MKVNNVKLKGLFTGFEREAKTLGRIQPPPYKLITFYASVIAAF
jgi:hypothetical protein